MSVDHHVKDNLFHDFCAVIVSPVGDHEILCCVACNIADSRINGIQKEHFKSPYLEFSSFKRRKFGSV